jgi:hypothetical protein
MKIKEIDEITSQALREISFDRTYKSGKITNWQKNEDVYYNKKISLLEARSNVNLARGQEFVHTLLSKIKTLSLFKFSKRKESQLQRVLRLNALKNQDSKNDFWNIKDVVGKKQVIIYGRAIYSYYADSVDKEYKAHLENVDVYDFLIDPSSGGIDIDRARNLGRYGVIKTRQELELMKKDKTYIKDNIMFLLSGTGNNFEQTKEDTNKNNRTWNQDTVGNKELHDNDKFKFWEWFTTYQGERYYLLLNESTGKAIRIMKLVDMFSASKYFPLGAWPFWSWAAYPDLTEFWTPAPLDFVRDILAAQDVSINQMLDNAEAVNKPQKAVQVGNIENMAELKYRRDGVIRVKKDVDINSAIKMLQVPSINTPIQVFEVLEGILQKSSGVTDASKGMANEDGRVAIYEGNEENSAERYGILYDSYTMGLERFARLYEIGVRDNLTKKIAVEMIGPDGVETEEISKRDIYIKGDDFSVLVESTNADKILSNSQQKAKLLFLSGEINNPDINTKKVFEIKASIAGFNQDEIKEMLDKSEYGNTGLMAECARDIESLLNKENIKPNGNANNAYKQKMVDWLVDHEEDMDIEMFNRITVYISSLEPIIIKNEAAALKKFEINQLTASALGGGSKTTAINNIPTPEEEYEETTGDFEI